MRSGTSWSWRWSARNPRESALARWRAFLDLLASPPIVSDLARGTVLAPDR
jgi:hypothetical protein